LPRRLAAKMLDIGSNLADREPAEFRLWRVRRFIV
jgi:hypothetical protein